MDKKALLEEYQKELGQLKNDLGFKSSLEDLEEIFFLKDMVANDGYISSRPERAIARNMVNLFMSWNNYFHSIIMPNPSSMISISESQMFSDDDKARIIKTMNTILAHTSKNMLVGFKNDKKLQGQFFDDSVNLWKSTVKPLITFVLEKVQSEWEKKSKEEPQVKKKFE